MWRCLAVLVLATAAASCGRTASSGGETCTLHVGDRVDTQLNQTAIRFVGVSQDSRCPADVVCVWAGDAVVQLDLIQSGDSARVELHTNSAAGSTSVQHGPAILRLAELAPIARSSGPVPASEYVATLDVSPLPMP